MSQNKKRYQRKRQNLPIERFPSMTYQKSIGSHIEFNGFGHFKIDFNKNYKNCLHKIKFPKKMDVHKQKKEIMKLVKELINTELLTIEIPKDNILLTNLRRQIFKKIIEHLLTKFPHLTQIIGDTEQIKYMIYNMINSQQIINEDEEKKIIDNNEDIDLNPDAIDNNPDAIDNLSISDSNSDHDSVDKQGINVIKDIDKFLSKQNSRYINVEPIKEDNDETILQELSDYLSQHTTEELPSKDKELSSNDDIEYEHSNSDDDIDIPDLTPKKKIGFKLSKKLRKRKGNLETLHIQKKRRNNPNKPLPRKRIIINNKKFFNNSDISDNDI